MDSAARRAACLAAFLLCAPVFTGCTPAIGQVYNSIKGSDGRVWMLKPIEGKLDRFTSLTIEEFGCEMEGGVPPAVLERLEPEIKRYLLDKGVYKNISIVANSAAQIGDASVLILRGVVIDYDPGGVAGRIFGVSGERFLTARIHFIDGASGNVIGVGHVAGVVKGDIGRDQFDTLTGMAKGIADIVKEHTGPPPPEKK